MQTLTVTCKNHDPPLSVTVSRATGLMEIHRGIHVARALVQIKEKLGLQPEEPFPKGFERIIEVCMAQSTWPNCMACLVRSEGFPLTITFEGFCQLPEQFVARWERAALALNPHWRHIRPTRSVR